MGGLKLKRGASRLWALLYRVGVARQHMPFWRVVVEGKLDREARRWPRRHGSAVSAVFVWARTIEEAEGLATLAMEAEGLIVQTADAQKTPPSAAPRRTPAAVARLHLAFLPLLKGEAQAGGAPRRDARA